MRWFTAVWRHRAATRARWTYRSKESVITFSAWPRCVLISFSQHHLFALIHTCQEADKPEKGQKGEIKARRKHVIVGCSRADWLMLLSSRARLRGRPGPARSAALGFMSAENVSMLCAKETKCGILKKKTLFSVIKFNFPLFLTYTILVGLIMPECLNQRSFFIELKKRK